MLALTIVVCLLPRVPGPDFVGADKLEHLLGWAALSAWFGSLFERRTFPWLVVIMIAIGGGIEVLQSWMALGRQGDWRDVLFNSAGVATGLFVAGARRESWFALVERWLPAT